MDILKKNWLRFSAAIILCTLFRLLPFRPPNIEPILATQMPFSRFYGKFIGFLFAFLNILIFDLITFKLGLWTIITAFTYGFLGILAYYFFKKEKNNTWSYVKFAVIGTIFFDVVTGLSIGPLFFGQSFIQAFVGQIPFTFWHLLGNISFAVVLSPSLYKFIIKNEKFEDLSIINVFNLKKV